MQPLERTLDTLRQYDPEKVEISIVDDGSILEPITDEKLIEWAMPNLFVFSLPPKKEWKNPCVPLNLAVAQSTAPLILLQSPETYHVGPIATKMRESFWDWKDVVLACVKTEGLGFKGLKWYMHPIHRPVRWWFCQMMTRRFWDEIGGMDERYRDGNGWDDNYLEDKLTEASANWIWREDCEAVHVCTPKNLPRATNRTLFKTQTR